MQDFAAGDLGGSQTAPFYGRLAVMDLAAGIAVHFNASGGIGFETYTQTCCMAQNCKCNCDVSQAARKMMNGLLLT